ncbi:MAG: ATP synthase F1 subunit gamma, partial [Rudaea sp.]
IGLILFTADRGLAGAYNQNMLRKTVDFIKTQPAPCKLITVGRRGRDLARRLGYEIVADFSGIGDRPQLGQISALARGATDEYLEHRDDRVYVGFTDFINVLRQVPTIRQILPIPAADRTHEGPEAIYLYEPSAEQILAEVLPRFVQVQIYQALLEATASEHAARMVAMRNATDNANELIDSLTLLRNKVRQTAITKEMLDIAGGAEAQRQSLAGK